MLRSIQYRLYTSSAGSNRIKGRVRSKEEGQTPFGDSPLTLPVTTSVVSSFGGDRTVYRIEAVWDSSLHNSELFITGILRKLIEIENIEELWICRADPELKILPSDPKVDPKTKRIY